MRWFLAGFVLVALFLLPVSVNAAIIADHNVIGDFDNIPDYWLQEAKELALHYAHSSHGSQINSGLEYLESYVDPVKYSVAIRTSSTEGLPSAENPPALRIYDGNPPETYITPEDYWDTPEGMDRTRAVADTGNYDLSMWAWCGQQSYNNIARVQKYLDNLDTLESEYPGMRFIYMTGHLAGSTEYAYTCAQRETIKRNNDMIRNYVIANDRVLFDFADIEAYTDGATNPCTSNNNVGDCDPDTNVECDWVDTDPSCAHSRGPNCIRKAKAFWWMMARLAGWDGGAGYTCTGDCRDNSCSSYNDCYSASGTCPSGQSCCTGTCTTPCSGDCKTNTCDSYNDCTSASGTCTGGDYCCSGTCTTPPSQCSDGTPYGQCSSNQPLYCDNNGNLVNDCNTCGCPAGQDCQGDGSCQPTSGDSLIALYHFDEGSGTTVADSSVYGNNGTVNGATWTEGISGNALEFDGNDDYVDCGNDNVLDVGTNGEITLSAWVNVNSFPSGGDLSYIVGKGYNGSSEAYFFRLKDEGGITQLHAGSYYAGDVRHLLDWNISGWDIGEWHHVVGLYNGTAWKIYFDGTEKLSTVTGGPESNNMDVFIGAFDRTGEAQRFFNGKIDEVRIYSRALSDGEVLGLYNNVKSQGLFGYWKFDEGSGIMAADSSVYGNNGTVNGATWTEGISGNALEFDGDDYVDCGNDNVLDVGTNGEITLSAWVNVNSFPAGDDWSYIIGKGYGDSSEAYFLRLKDEGGITQLHIGSYRSGTPRHRIDWNISGWDTNEWHHVVGLYNGTAWKIYFDGTEKLSTVTGGPESNSRNVFIGAFDRTGEAQRFFNGKIDEVRIYSRALSDEEILEHYNEVKADLNNDDQVNLFDLQIVTMDFGKTSGFDSRADTVLDGEIDVFDLVFVASRFT